MKITIGILMDSRTCEGLITWFKETFGVEADSEDVLKALQKVKMPNEEIVSRTDWACWLSNLCVLDVKWPEFSCVDGELNGEYKIWFENGQLAHCYNYKNGKKARRL